MRHQVGLAGMNFGPREASMASLAASLPRSDARPRDVAVWLLGIAALVPFTLFFIYWVQGDGAGHVQSLIFGAVLFNAAVVMGALAVIGDIFSR